MTNSWLTGTVSTAGLSKRDRAMPNSNRRSLADLANASGALVPCAGNLPLDLGDPQFVWFVEAGAVDVFLVERGNGIEQSALQQLMRAETGRLLFGISPQKGETTLSLTAKGLPGTLLRRLPTADLAALRHAELAALVDAWVMDVSATLSRDVMYLPRSDMLVEAGRTPTAEGGTITARRGVVWVQAPASSSGERLFMDIVEVETGDTDEAAASEALPLTPASWLKLMPPQRLSAALSSETLAGGGHLLPALTRFHEVALSLERINRLLAVADQANLERASTATRRIDEDRARRRLFNLHDAPERGEDDDDGSALARALRIVGRHEGIEFKWPTRTDAPEIPPDFVDILDASGVRGRQVRLAAKHRWWMGDSGAMLGFRADDGGPVALLPSALGRYRIFDPATGRTSGITAERAESIKENAWLFYRSLEPTITKSRDLLRVFGKGLGASFACFTMMGLMSGLIMLLPAMALGSIANRVIPAGEFGLLYLATGGLAAFAVIWALIYILQGMALMRIEGRFASRIEAAFWDRLLRLPLGFLHRLSSGERAVRGMAFQRLRDALQGVTANNVFSIAFLFPALLVIFFYNAALGSVTVAFGLLSLFVTVALGLRQMRPYARAIRASHRLAGILFQFINGISKLRIDGAERSAYAVWARNYSEQQRAELELGAWKTHLQAFGAALPLLAGATLLSAATLQGPESLAVGDFLVVYTAFMLFVTGVVRLGSSFGAVAAVAPELAQIRPFLAEAPEASGGQEPVEHLGGEIVFDRVTFRYEPTGPPILDDVSIHARRGEFIAIAGESGAGKSTLFRLALGLNEPSSGAVYYDGRDLRQLNVNQLRRKIGAVPQQVRLHPQDLWDNIAGDKEDIDADTVWQAARTAAVDEAVARMPMQMLTCVGDSQSVLSGGESQRITIARAVARDPRILLLDEATNFLDNESQSTIMDQFAQLPATRIVIAHRLSTLRRADRIYVMQSGKVVEEGTYAELTATDGVFRDLVRRQEA